MIGSQLWAHSERVSLCSEALPQTSAAVIVGGVIGAVIGIIIIAVVTYLIIRRREHSHVYEGYVCVIDEPCRWVVMVWVNPLTLVCMEHDDWFDTKPDSVLDWREHGRLGLNTVNRSTSSTLNRWSSQTSPAHISPQNKAEQNKSSAFEAHFTISFHLLTYFSYLL